MARYRQKDSTDLAWNDIRRRITRQLDTEIKAVREYWLNKLLTGAWDEFEKSLESGEELVLESDYRQWVDTAIREVIGGKVDALDVADMDETPQ